MVDMSAHEHVFVTPTSVCCLILILITPFVIRKCKPDIPPTRSSSDVQIEADRSFVPLMDFENGYVIMVQMGVTTVNFFPAKDVHFSMSKKKLRNRLKKICEANPWLVGTIIRDKKRHERLMCTYPNIVTDDDIDAVFLTEESDSTKRISSSTSYDKLAEVLKKSGAICKSGFDVVNKPDRVLKASLFPINGSQEFAFVFSISHLMADGHTYYKLLSMLADGSTIDSLKVQRVDGFENAVVRTIGKAGKELLESGFIVGNLIKRTLFGPPIYAISANYLDPEKIAKAKQEATKEQTVGFVSTNDIITSAFGNAVDCGLLAMALNLRGRTREAGENLAGNYETLLAYDTDSFDTPAKIRQSLNRGPPFKRVSEKAPMTRWQELTTPISLITNWSFPCFDADIHLWQKDGSPSSSVMLHLPLYVIEDSAPIPTLVVFKPCKGRLAIICTYHENNNYHSRLVKDGELLGTTVSPGMFFSKRSDETRNSIHTKY